MTGSQKYGKACYYFRIIRERPLNIYVTPLVVEDVKLITHWPHTKWAYIMAELINKIVRERKRY